MSSKSRVRIPSALSSKWGRFLARGAPSVNSVLAVTHRLAPEPHERGRVWTSGVGDYSWVQVRIGGRRDDAQVEAMDQRWATSGANQNRLEAHDQLRAPTRRLHWSEPDGPWPCGFGTQGAVMVHPSTAGKSQRADSAHDPENSPDSPKRHVNEFPHVNATSRSQVRHKAHQAHTDHQAGALGPGLLPKSTIT